MSGTRSRSKMARAIKRPLLIVAAHGERGGTGRNERLRAIARSTAAKLAHWDVACGVLSGSPSIEEAVAGAGSRPVAVWPFFLCGGYFVTTVLRAHLDAVLDNYAMLPEYGSDPALATTAHRMLTNLPGGMPRSVLVVAHGSAKGDQSRLSAVAFGWKLGRLIPEADIGHAFLEEPPFADQIIASLPDGAAIVSLFAGDGLHGSEDVPLILLENGRCDLHLVTPAAEIDAVAEMAAKAARGCGLDRMPTAAKTRTTALSSTLPLGRSRPGSSETVFRASDAGSRLPVSDR